MHHHIMNTLTSSYKHLHAANLIYPCIHETWGGVMQDCLLSPPWRQVKNLPIWTYQVLDVGNQEQKRSQEVQNSEPKEQQMLLKYLYCGFAIEFILHGVARNEIFTSNSAWRFLTPKIFWCIYKFLRIKCFSKRNNSRNISWNTSCSFLCSIVGLS